MFEIQPVRFGKEFALAATLYLTANFLVSLLCLASHPQHGPLCFGCSLWMSGVAAC
jgi:hypothetical protein